MRIGIIALLIFLSVELSGQNPDSAKKEQYLEIGSGFLTLGDFVWYDDYDNPIFRPSYTGFIFPGRESNAKALPLSITYKKQRKSKRWFWYTQLLLEFARNRYNSDSYYYIDYQGVYSNVWGFEYQYIKQQHFSMSLKLGLGIGIYHYVEKRNEPIAQGGSFTEIFPFPAFEIQPFCFRFGTKNAMFTNLSLGTTGLIQIGYSRKW